MKTIKILAVFFLLVISSGCAPKLPTFKEGYGMIAVPYHLINRTNFKFLSTYEWKSSEDEAFSVKIQHGTYTKDVAISELIPSGNYTIDTLVIKSVAESKVISSMKKIERKIEPPFELNISPGSIMIVPIVYQFEQYLENDAILIQNNVHNIEDEEEKFYIDRIKKRENFNQWKIDIYGKEGGKRADNYEQLLRSAEQGNADAQYNLGILYDGGQGVPQDHAKAMKWYRKAAEQGIGGAQFSLGLMYNYGKGVPKNCSEAIKWYHKAADQEYALAQYKLGIEYDGGLCVPQDYAKAAMWYRKAADQGEAEAQYNLGVMYYDGRGVQQDYLEAMKWYRKAAEQEDKKAQFNLAVMYQNGQGVTKDDKEAVRWFKKAADQGFEAAVKALELKTASLKSDCEEDESLFPKMEQWDFTLDSHLGAGVMNLTVDSNGEIAANGNWYHRGTKSIYEDATTNIDGASIAVKITGIATNSSAPAGNNTSKYTITIKGKAISGHATGQYIVEFHSTGWPEPYSGSWEATRVNGCGLTASTNIDDSR